MKLHLKKANDNIDLNQRVDTHLCMHTALTAWELYNFSEEFIHPKDCEKYRQGFAQINTLIQQEMRRQQSK